MGNLEHFIGDVLAFTGFDFFLYFCVKYIRRYHSCPNMPVNESPRGKNDWNPPNQYKMRKNIKARSSEWKNVAHRESNPGPLLCTRCFLTTELSSTPPRGASFFHLLYMPEYMLTYNLLDHILHGLF